MKQEFVLLKNIIIPAGTVLSRACEERGGASNVEAVIGMGKDSTANFNMSLMAIDDMPEDLITKVK